MQMIPTPTPPVAPTTRSSQAPDVRPAADPSSGRAFRAALNAARQNNDNADDDRSSGRQTGRSDGSTRSDGSVQANGTGRRQTVARPEGTGRTDGTSRPDDADAADDTSSAEAAVPPNELAALLAWVAPKTTTDALVMPLLGPTPGGQQTGPTPGIVDAAVGAATAAIQALLGTDDPLTGSLTTPQATVGQAPDLDANPGAIQLPNPAVAGASTGASNNLLAAAASDQARLAMQAANRPLAAMTGQSPDADPTATPPLAPTAPGPDAATAAPTSGTPAPAAPSVVASGATPTTWADLAASFGAQLVTTTPTAARAPGGASGLTGPASTATTDPQAQSSGSTAQAAGATNVAPLQLPGQAVAGAGSADAATPATVAEAMQARTTGEATSRPSQTTPDQTLAFNAMLGVNAGAGLAQAQATVAVPGSTVTAPPLAAQIADGAVAASRNLGQSVQMVLQPEGLGTVSLKVTLEHGSLGVRISVDNPQAREMLQASFSQLQQALDQRGLSVHSMQLDLSNGRGNGGAFQQFQQFGGQQSQGQQSRAGSGRASRRESASVLAIDESTRVQPGAASNGRVDYRI